MIPATWRTARWLGDAGFIVSLAIWLTMVSVRLGSLLTDRLGQPNLSIVAVYYTTYYIVMAGVQLAARGGRDLFGTPRRSC